MRKKIFFSLFMLILCFIGVRAEKVTTPVLGTDYSFNLADGSIISTTVTGKDTVNYGILRVYPGPSNTYRWNDAVHGMEFKIGNFIELDVAGSVTIKIGGCQYSAAASTITVSDKNGTFTDTRSSKQTDCVTSVDFVYTGKATTLIIAFAGGKSYVPNINVVAAKDGSKATSALKNVIYDFNLCDGSIISKTTTGKNDTLVGLFSLTVGTQSAYQYHGTQHGSVLKTGNKVTLPVAGNSKIILGGCQYSGGSVAISSATGAFDKTSQITKTTNCYDQTGDVVSFTYVGTAGTVTLEFTGTNYVPCMQIQPIPYAVELDPWVQKTGQIVVNGVAIDLTAGANSTANATVSVGAGTVVSATVDAASVRINLGGKALSEVPITYSGQIASVTVNEKALDIVYADTLTSKPYRFKITVADNSKTISAEAGKTYSYNFFDGTVIPQTAYSSLRYGTFITEDGMVTINSNTETTAGQFGYHDSAHGLVLFAGNSFKFIVAGDATITFNTCQYAAAADAIYEITDANGAVLEDSLPAQDKGAGACGAHSFSYTGPAGVITATLKSAAAPAGEFYLHGVAIENAAKIIKTTKTDVWDLGAVQLDTTLYNNQLTEAVINGFYTGVTAGTTGKTLPSFTAGVLSWVGGGNDRLRTSNTNLTRYDANGTATIGGVSLTGCIYVNSSAATSRYLSLTLSEDDEVSIYSKSQNSVGKLNFVYVPAPAEQTDVFATTSGAIASFVAKKAGAYHIYDTADKPMYYRIQRKDATYATLSGSVNTAEAPGIPAGYGIVMTNEAGKVWTDTVTGGNYSIKVPVGYTYSLSLFDASGYIITNGAEITVTQDAIHEIAVKKVVMFKVTGSVKGLGNNLSKLSLTYTPSVAKIYVPQPVVNTVDTTYSVMLEPNCEYTVSAKGVNDFYIPSNKVTITEVDTLDLVFQAKPVYAVTLDVASLTEAQKALLSITLTNLNETGYAYTFTGLSNIALRTGVYSISCTGLDSYPLQLGPTSNLKVEDAVASKTLAFIPVTNWSFDDATILATTTAYKGMLFTGGPANEKAKGHLVAKVGNTIQVPVNPGEKVVVTFYYSASFMIEGGDTIKTVTSTGSTSAFEAVEYVYTGSSAGYVTILNGTTTTYFTEIKTLTVVPYSATLTVGKDKTYQTINDAMAAVRAMNRTSSERVKVMIDPGNYEEMLSIDVANVSLVNAAATPSIALANKGVDISENAVRITSYYGHGYNYYSMGTDQKWNAETLRVNKENGYTTYSNTGSGTTNNSYWNATVLVSATGFEAENIIFENSYNQYISQKESEDVVVEWAIGGKGLRPVTVGSTAVQNKSFVERAAAIAYLKSADKAVLNNCRIVGRQDSYYGAEGARIVNYKGVIMGGTDYIFGGMTLVCYKTELAMNTSDVNTDQAYLTAAQQNTARGYLMYECTVNSAKPGTETASSYLSKPGLFGRPWQATTSEVVFYKTTIDTTNYPAFEGKSMIDSVAWSTSLGGASDKCYEFGTIEKSGVNNAAFRASWSKVLTVPMLTDNTDITCFNFTKGSDDWDPIPTLIASDPDGLAKTSARNGAATLFINRNTVTVSGIQSKSSISVYNVAGTLIKSLQVSNDAQFELANGFWMVKVVSAEGIQSAKVIVK
jgi:hypothetical protein